MASLKLLLGLIPSTTKLELNEKALTDEYEKLRAFVNSELLSRYNTLNDLINSPDFRQKKKEIESLQYKNSEEYVREKEFSSLQKSRDIVLFFKTAAGSALKKFREMEGSAQIRDYESLQEYINSFEFKQKQKMKPITFKDSEEYRKFREYKNLKKDPEIKSYYKAAAKGEATKSAAVEKFEELKAFINSSGFLEKKKMKPITFRDTEEYKKLLEYRRLRNSSEIKNFYKFRDSREYASFLNVDGSQKLARYNELKDYVASSEFREKKNYYLDKKRFEKTEMFKNIQEFNTLKKNEDIIWYFKVKDSDKFDVIKNRELIFCDEFNADRLDTTKWLTNYYWGDKLLHERYSVEGDLQTYTENENFEIRNSLLKIITRPQNYPGKIWTPTDGFRPHEFRYTSGIVNTGKSFRHQYGIFSAKIKLGNPAAKNAFWMLSDKITPHIDVCRTSNGKVQFDYFPSVSKIFRSVAGSRYARDFYIYTLEWTPDKLVWKINGTVAFTCTTDVPREPMYILFSGGLDKALNSMTAMEIDWVRVYKPV
ncbi:MAG: glycoside hydrolase family 16 protein [Bacteroidales bacterium]|nr:glycoside hydrolase family 16 protein [Bacteroidales bacterium]